MNPWYERLFGSNQLTPQQSYGQTFQNPMQKAQYIMQAMRNPVAFVKEQFPDIPDNIISNPMAVLQYLQQSRGISNDQLNQIISQYPRRY